MIVDIGLYLAIGVLLATGVYLLLDRSLTRMLMGLILAGNGANLLLLTLASPPGHPPIEGFFSFGRDSAADPLAQAMILTAIVITMGMSAFILALAYRSFTINTDDEVDDDPEDTKVLERDADRADEDPDFDASDDPVTGLPSAAGDAFGPDGHRLSPEELRQARVDALDTGAVPVHDVNADDERGDR
ncbi:Na(+)/H(+) antiporter subunit C [Tsukamurella sp. 8F]|uniref:Na(+)/H(+) antiporter subunit C n=1 Tax=unclassified Tsukamurella TaxID=2633480 RepID=UPI0023B99273|nr:MULTISPECIES: Na(+)/H(+) antiporter subunit C [unclassified Tsukamurella]MDF0529472.1 Na(+)/H(+) antiporter subunit C [Tsukamurella sp. 8J]MDF0585840.1 Na(+)/H(+) antiporter subunit C [Tsukamurella sp. 8F]